MQTTPNITYSAAAKEEEEYYYTGWTSSYGLKNRH